MRTQWTTTGDRDASSSCSCDRGLHRYLQNFGGGWGWTPPVRHCLLVPRFKRGCGTELTSIRYYFRGALWTIMCPHLAPIRYSTNSSVISIVSSLHVVTEPDFTFSVSVPW